MLGLCYGAQLMMHVLGGEVKRADVREYGKTEVIIDKKDSKLFSDVVSPTVCWMSHFDYIAETAPGFEISAHTADCPVAAAENEAEKLYAVQFHPEVLHTAEGNEDARPFRKNVCGCSGDWKMDSFVENSIEAIREKVGDGKVLLALSAAWIPPWQQASVQSDRPAADLRIRRPRPSPQRRGRRGGSGLRPKRRLRSELHPRQRPGALLQQAGRRDRAGAKAQDHRRGIYPRLRGRGEEDRRGRLSGPGNHLPGRGGERPRRRVRGHQIHHNVGGLPDYVDFKEIIEPLRDLFKDEVRKAGLELGLPELVFRQPFPGPGLGVRIIGEVTAEKVKIVQDADAIYREEIAKPAGPGDQPVFRGTDQHALCRRYGR